jgi:hypothetical protein
VSAEIFNVEQGTDEWFKLRLGIPTASMFSDVCAQPGPRGGVPKGRQTYMYKLAGEIITGEPRDSFTNAHMERGIEREAEDRALYSMLTDVEVEQVGFIRNGNVGCSPDGLIRSDGAWENKNALPHIQIERLLAATLPPEHADQCQGALMVSEREWIDFQSSSRGMPPLIVRVHRDEKRIAEIRASVDVFQGELDLLVEKIRKMW